MSFCAVPPASMAAQGVRALRNHTLRATCAQLSLAAASPAQLQPRVTHASRRFFSGTLRLEALSSDRSFGLAGSAGPRAAYDDEEESRPDDRRTGYGPPGRDRDSFGDRRYGSRPRSDSYERGPPRRPGGWGQRDSYQRDSYSRPPRFGEEEGDERRPPPRDRFADRGSYGGARRPAGDGWRGARAARAALAPAAGGRGATSTIARWPMRRAAPTERADTYEEARIRLRRAERRRVPRPRWEEREREEGGEAEQEEEQEAGGPLRLDPWREVRRGPRGAGGGGRRRGGEEGEEEREEGEFRSGDAVDVEIIEFTRLGVRVLVNGTADGLIFDSDVQRGDLRVGDTMKGYVRMARPDGKLDISLRKPGLAGVLDATRAILAVLKDAGGELPYGDDSTPEEVKRVFAMSKVVFKRALGNLWKEGRIEWTDDGGIRLVPPRERDPRP
eukprot:tig00021680_g23024.t1